MKRTNTPYKVGLTGGIGTGKSTAVKYLNQNGYFIIDADEIAREVVEIGSEGLNAVVTEFGEGILNEDLSLNRKELGEIVFKTKEKLNKLNQILHPLIRERIQYYEKQNSHLDVIFYDVPLLFETKQQNLYNEVLLIYASHETALSRVIERDRISESLARMKINAQFSMDIKKNLADFVIENEVTLDQLHKQLDHYIDALRTRIENWQKNNEH